MSREQRLAFLRASPRAAMNPLEPGPRKNPITHKFTWWKATADAPGTWMVSRYLNHEPVFLKDKRGDVIVYTSKAAAERAADDMNRIEQNPVDLSHFDQTQVKRGIKEETKEHGAKLAPRVVADHLALDPHYYAKKPKGKAKAAAVITQKKVTVEETTAVVAAEAKRNPTNGKLITGKQHMKRKQAEREFRKDVLPKAKGSPRAAWNDYLVKLRSEGRIWQSERDEWTIPKDLDKPGRNPVDQRWLDVPLSARATSPVRVNWGTRTVTYVKTNEDAEKLIAATPDPHPGAFVQRYESGKWHPARKPKKNPAPTSTGIQEWGYVWQLDCIDPKGKPFTVKLGNMQWMMGHDPDGVVWPKNEALIVRYTLTDEHEITDVPKSMRKYAGRGPIYGGQFMAPSGADWKLAGVCHHIWYERVGTKHPGHWQHPYGEHGEPLPNLYTWTHKGRKFYRLCLGEGAVWNVRGFVTP